MINHFKSLNVNDSWLCSAIHLILRESSGTGCHRYSVGDFFALTNWDRGDILGSASIPMVWVYMQHCLFGYSRCRALSWTDHFMAVCKTCVYKRVRLLNANVSRRTADKMRLDQVWPSSESMTICYGLGSFGELLCLESFVNDQVKDGNKFEIKA